MAFEHIKGQDIAVRMLENELRSDRLPHTLLFFGPDGSGKFTTALELVRVLGCREGRNSSPACGCPNCTAVKNMVSRDLLVVTKSRFKDTFERWRRYGVREDNLSLFIHDLRRVTAALADEGRLQKQYESLQELLHEVDEIRGRAAEIVEQVLELDHSIEGAVIGIDSIRQVQRFLSLRSAEGQFRAVILDGAERMNLEASNCFLKISEDTPDRGLIILITCNRDQLRETIRSRSRAYRFKPLPEELMDRIVEDRHGAKHHGAAQVSELPVQPYFEQLAEAGRDLVRLNETVREIVDKGHTTLFLGDLVSRLRSRVVRLTQREEPGADLARDAQKIDELLKKIEFTRNSVLKFHVNPVTALTDVLLNNGTSLKRYALSGSDT